MSKTLSSIRVEARAGGVLAERHDIHVERGSSAGATTARLAAMKLAMDESSAGRDVTVIEFYADGSRFEFAIA